MMEKNRAATSAMRTAFWSWMVIISGGLLVTIVLPLAGR